MHLPSLSKLQFYFCLLLFFAQRMISVHTIAIMHSYSIILSIISLFNLSSLSNYYCHFIKKNKIVSSFINFILKLAEGPGVAQEYLYGDLFSQQERGCLRILIGGRLILSGRLSTLRGANKQTNIYIIYILTPEICI